MRNRPRDWRRCLPPIFDNSRASFQPKYPPRARLPVRAKLSRPGWLTSAEPHQAMASDLRHSDLEAFIVRVQMDHGLQEKLRPFADRESFVAAVLHISLELGFVVRDR